MTFYAIVWAFRQYGTFNSNDFLLPRQNAERLKTSHSFLSNTQPNTMVQELSYTVTNNVLESWEQIRRIKNYQQVAGVKLFQK
jgi:hypothetical protein